MLISTSFLSSINPAKDLKKLNDTDTDWAEEVLEADKERVVLTEESKNYNIHEAVKALEMKYKDLLRG